MTGKLRGVPLLVLLVVPGTAAGQEEAAAEAAGGGEGGGEVRIDQGEEAEAAAEEKERLPYRGTSITYSNSFTAISLDPDYQQDYNPEYVMSWSFNPRYYLYDQLSARLGFSVDLELTDSDSTQTRYEPWVSDITLGFGYAPFYTIPVVDIRLSGVLTFGFPTSKISQARTLYLSLSPSLGIARDFDVLGGLTLSYTFKYTKNFNKYSGAVSEDAQFPCPLGLEDRTECFNMGTRNPSMSFSNAFEAQLYFIAQLYLSLGVTVINTLLYPVAPATVQTLTGPVRVAESEDNTNHRGSMSYKLELGYDVLPYLSLALGVSTSNSQLKDDGTLREPFFNRFSVIYLDVGLAVDALVEELTSGSEEETPEEAAERRREERATANGSGALAAW